MSDQAAEKAPETARPSAGRVWGLRVARVVVTALAFGWVLSRVDLAALGEAFLRVPITAFLLALTLTMLNLGIGTIRWRTLMSAYGAETIPSFAKLYRIYWIGFFYNLWLPGGLGVVLLKRDHFYLSVYQKL